MKSELLFEISAVEELSIEQLSHMTVSYVTYVALTKRTEKFKS